jgi:GNAT superfamily N-acetyltransferase
VNLVVAPLTPERWPDLEAVFQAKGCSVARGCWCMFYRESGRQPPLAAGQTQATRRRSQLQALAAADPPAGLIGYRDGQPVGWVSFGPREQFAKLAKSPVMKPVDDAPVWSVVCFVVPAPYRAQGIASALLRAAAAYARERGASLLEGYPVDKAGRSTDEFLWFGAKSMFDAAGFEEVARRKPQRPVMRLDLSAASPARCSAGSAPRPPGGTSPAARRGTTRR